MFIFRVLNFDVSKFPHRLILTEGKLKYQFLGLIKGFNLNSGSANLLIMTGEGQDS